MILDRPDLFVCFRLGNLQDDVWDVKAHGNPFNQQDIIKIMLWINNYIHSILLGVIIHTCLTLNGCLTKLPLKLLKLEYPEYVGLWHGRLPPCVDRLPL